MDQNTRSFNYNWAGDYAVDSFSIQVQQPIGATNMQLTPNLGSGLPGEGGLTYYNAMIGQVPAGTEFTLDIHYQKTDSQLSIEKLQVNPSQPLDTNTAGRVSLQQILPYIIGAFGVLLVGGGAWWLWLSRQPKWSRVPENRKRHAMGPTPQTDTNHSSRGSEAAVKPANDQSIYCHQCGRRAAAGDLFCRTCGTPLRKE